MDNVADLIDIVRPNDFIYRGNVTVWAIRGQRVHIDTFNKDSDMVVVSMTPSEARRVARAIEKAASLCRVAVTSYDQL